MKLSEFPKGTVIQIAGRGLYVLSDDAVISYNNKDERFSRAALAALAALDESEEYHEIAIVSVPWGVTVQLVNMLRDEYGHNDAEGNPITFDRVLSDAVKQEKVYLQSLTKEKVK